LTPKFLKSPHCGNFPTVLGRRPEVAHNPFPRNLAAKSAIGSWTSFRSVAWLPYR
jgi:hypothetical protein